MDTSQYNWYAVQPWQLPPEKGIVKVIINKKACFISRFQDTYYAGNAKCPHAGGDLSKGFISGAGEIVCPLHDLKFNLKDGQENTQQGGFCISTYPVKQAQDGQFYIGFLKGNNWFGL